MCVLCRVEWEAPFHFEISQHTLIQSLIVFHRVAVSIFVDLVKAGLFVRMSIALLFWSIFSMIRKIRIQPVHPSVWVCEFKNGKAFELTDLENLPSDIGDDLESGIDVLTIPNALVTETSIRIPQGAAVGRQKLEKWQDWYPGEGNNGNGKGNNIFSRGKQGSGNRRLLTDGTRTVLVVRVVASDATTTASLDRLSDSVFGGVNDTVTLASQYAACSHGQLNFVKAPDRTGISTNIVNGAVEVTVGTSTSQGDATMSNAIVAELNSQFNVTSPTQLANHVMMCLPPNTMSGIACKC